MPLIEIKDLHKTYRPHDPPALDGVSLEVNKGEVVVIIGASGSGKSTLLRCVNRLVEPSSGEIWFRGVNLVDKETNINHERENIGMVFQSFNLFTHMKVIDNLVLGMSKIKGMSDEEARSTAMSMLESVGLDDKAESFPAELSGGQQQRVAIARELAMNPELMLFDEPTSALDPELVGGVIEIMADLAKKHMTMMVVTHEIAFAREAADRIIYMDEGKILEQGPPKEILTNPQNERTKEFLQRIIESHQA